MSEEVFPDPRLIDLLRSMNSAMPPWEAYRWFDTPRESEFTGLVTGDLIAPHDVRRVTLIVSVQQTSDSCRITTKSGVESGRGILLAGGQAPWVITHQQHGLLTQVDWFVASAPLSGICVIEVLLRAWPGEPGIG